MRARTTKFCAIVATLPIGTVVMDARMVTQDPPDALGRRVPEGTMSGDKKASKMGCEQTTYVV